MGLQVLALACLVGAIILGFVRKMECRYCLFWTGTDPGNYRGNGVRKDLWRLSV